jgi:hypothetical protein
MIGKAHLWILMALGALCLGTGCAEPESIQIRGKACASDSECGGDLCILGVCADPDDPSFSQVHQEVRPPESSGFLPQQTLNLPTDITERKDVKLRPRIALEGQVQNSSQNAEAAWIIAVPDPESQIPGRTLAVAENNEADGTFTVLLNEEGLYRLSVHPTDTAVAPFFVEDGVLARPESGQTIQLENPIQLAAPSELVTVSGRLTAGTGSAALAIPDMEVRVLDERRVVSSVARSDDNGFFAVQLAPGIHQGLNVEIRPTEDNPLFPNVSLESLTFFENTDLGTVDLGEIQGPVPFSAVVLGPGGDPVAGARVYAHAEIGVGAVRLLLASDAAGRVEAALPAGTYQVAVVAPAAADAGLLISEVNLEVGADQSSGHTLQLESRTSLSGTIQDHRGIPVEAAEVVFNRISDQGGAESPALARVSWTFSALSDGDGNYGLKLDPGRYRITVIPAYGASVPRHSLVVDVGRQAQTEDIDLAPPAVFAGRLLDPTGIEKVGNTTVRIFAAFLDGEGEPVVTENGEPPLLGEALTGSDGTFDVILPDLVAGFADR